MKKRANIIFYITTLIFSVMFLSGHMTVVRGAEQVTTDTAESTTVTEEEVELVSDVTGKIVKTNQYKISWNTKVEGSLVSIQRASKKNGKYKELKAMTCKTGKGTYTDKTLKLNKTYYYKVVVNNEAIGQEKVISLKIKSILATPTAFTVKEGDSKTAKITWKKVGQATGYQIYRSTNKTKNYKKIATVGKKNSYTDKGIKSGKIYYYRIRAIKKNNSAAKSKYTSVVMLCMKPAKVKVSGEYTSSKVQLSWKKVTGATTYYIYKKNEDGKYERIGSTTKLKYTDSDVKENKTYYYKVAAAYKKNNKTYLGTKSSACRVYTADIDPNKKMIALTFDDGPGPYTNAIVKCLKENNARATFFVVGNRVNTYKSALKNTYKAGNEIANHSYDHSNLTKLSTSAIKKQMTMTDVAVKSVIGVKTTLVRTPGGAVNSKVKNAVGKPIIFWSIDTLDWKTRSKTKTINSVIDNVKDGDIILMHDIHKPTKEAALVLIPKLKKMGYQLVTVSELSKYRGYKLKNGTVYSSYKKK